MPQRVIYSIAGQEKTLAALPHAPLGRYADGIVFATADNAALTLLARAPAYSLLFFAKETYDHAMRQLPEPERDAAIRKRLARWAQNAVSEGMDWLYRSERRCLALTAMTMQGPQRATIPADHFEHTMVALHRLVNDGAYGSATLAGVLVFLIEGEALILVELSQQQAAAEIAERKQLSAGVAQALRTLGQPQYVQYPPYVEPRRAALVVPADQAVRQLVKIRVRPAIDWRGGLVSTFGVRDLETMAHQGKTVRILYLHANGFLQDYMDLTPAQLLRELEERFRAGALPFWEDHLNFLRLDTALMRRAAHEKALGENAAVAAQLAAQMPRDNALLLAALAKHPSWITDQDRPQQVTLVQAETEVVEDATFLARLAAARGQDEVHQRYRLFAEFKARQRQRL
jgi:hypothetical protein